MVEEGDARVRNQEGLVEKFLRCQGGPGDVPDAELILLHLEEHGGAVGVAQG